ncbi:MAG: tryptophan--tRNA ligase [Candidatus Falkowbacteria bacterium]
MTTQSKPTIFSGVQPSGNLTIGNYIGAISKWVELQDQYTSIFCVVDLHAITIQQDAKELNSRIIEITKHYLASGIDPKKSYIFLQSDISAHAELAWLLNCCTCRISDLKKMTQFKDKAGAKQENVSVGLFDYPVLMAADILLYNTDQVPVGDDQVQHVELCRDLAKRFNHQYGDTFKVPEVIIRQEGARIMALDDPTKKMSKSSSVAASYIGLLDDPIIAAKKITSATTDSDKLIKFNKAKKPGISNLLTIYSFLANTSIKDLEKKYQNKGYGDFKKDLSELVKEFLTKYQARYNSYSDAQIISLLKTNSEKLRPIAQKTLQDVKKKIGLLL